METIDLFESMYPIIFIVSKISSFVIVLDLLDFIYAKHLKDHDNLIQNTFRKIF